MRCLMVGTLVLAVIASGCGSDSTAEAVTHESESLNQVVEPESVAEGDSAVLTKYSVKTVGGTLSVTRREIPEEMPLHTFYLNGNEFYKDDFSWNILLTDPMKVGDTDVIPVFFLSGGNTPCIDGVGILGVKPDRTAYWISEGVQYCNATFSVEGDKVVMTDVVAEGRRTKTKKTYFSLNGEVSDAR